MKNLHSMNKAIAGLLMFMKSFAGSAFNLVLLGLVDFIGNGLGVQIFISQRMVGMIQSLGMSAKQAFVVSIMFSCLLSLALAAAIIQAVLHRQRMYNGILSFMSVILSAAGLSYVIFDKSHKIEHLADLSLPMYIALVMVAVVALLPPLVYNMNADLVEKTFGDVIDTFNDASLVELKKSLASQVKTLGKEDTLKADKQAEQRLRKMGVKPDREQPSRTHIPAGGEIDFSIFETSNRTN